MTRERVVSLGTGLIALACYAITASRTITWWEGSSYPLASCTLGIVSPPGSLLLTLLGWVVSRIPVIHPVAFRLNLFAGVLAAGTVALVTWLSIRLATPEERRPGWIEMAAGAVTGLAFGFELSIWRHAVQFTPYILSAGFTALILAAALAWWRQAAAGEARWRLFLLFLLLGLDFSVHRTNALLLPAALFWITLRRPAGWMQPDRWGVIAAGLAVGLSFHLLLIAISLRDPPINMGEPTSLSRLWSYVSLQQFGGGFLFRVFPRTADFLRVQVFDYWEFLRRNVMPAGVLSLLTFLPGLLIALGWLVGFRTSPVRSLGLLVFYVCASLGAVVYFNLPANYFRAMDRHYLPSLVLLTPWMAVGIAAILRSAARAPRAARNGLFAGVGAVLLLIPLGPLRANHGECDLSRVRFAETYSRDVLEPLPRNAILLTNGDNDTFPLWYLQWVEHVRPDVAVVNLPMTNMASYVAQLRRHDPRLRGLAAPPDPPSFVQLRDTRVWVAADEDSRATASVASDSVTFSFSGEQVGEDLVVLDLLRLTAGRRPVCVACTVTPSHFTWLWPYLRLEGLSYRLVPSADPKTWDVERLRHQLVEVVRYTDVADPTVFMDPASRALCSNYLAALLVLANAQFERGNASESLATLKFADAHVPVARLGQDPRQIAEFRTKVERTVPATP